MKTMTVSMWSCLLYTSDPYECRVTGLRVTDSSLTVLAEEKESGDEVECYSPVSYTHLLLVRERDSEGKIHISWGSQRIMN